MNTPNYHGDPQPSSQTGGRRYHIVDEEHLRDWVLAHVPELQRDTERMADLIRELVNHERQLRGLDTSVANGELYPNKNKRSDNEPDFLGEVKISGRFYRILARKGSDPIKGKFLKLVFLPK